MAEQIKITERKTGDKVKPPVHVLNKSNVPGLNSSYMDRVLHLQRTVGNREVTRLVRSGVLQAKLTIGRPGDIYEQEADRIADQVMRMPDEKQSLVNGHLSLVQRQSPCPGCEEEEKPISLKASGGCGGSDVMSCVESHINALKGSGQPLSPSSREFFEPRFGSDFSNVRVHAGSDAAAIATEINAKAFTTGNDIFFNTGQYSPGTSGGKNLLAHELTHVVQQGAAPGIQQRSTLENGTPQFRSGEVRMGLAGHLLQCWPGDGMLPPGDCGWARYLVLRGAVETAKAVVNMLGACAAGDNCLTLATKIAAITAEIAARLALDTTCFRGGDAGHRQQVQDKVNMLNRCYRFFNVLNCPPALVAAMAVVVERAREVIAAAAVVVALALVVALIAAVILLVEAIIAAIAAAAAGAAAAAAAGAAAVMAVLLLLLRNVSPEEGPPIA
ncbi:MAG: DUF4157 domain-containing protein [Candidatus Aminicenantes bacterium]|nr:DUF4157 domain-containing protein [Candidatus Aminicenantes bacterium]